LNLWSPISGLSMSYAGSALSPLGTFRLQDAGTELGMMPQCEQTLISPHLEGQQTTSQGCSSYQDDPRETFGLQALVAAREHCLPLQSGQSQWLTPERNVHMCRDSSTESRHDECCSNSSNDEPRRMRLHTWAEERALNENYQRIEMATSGSTGENTLSEAVSDTPQLRAAAHKDANPPKGSVTTACGDQQSLSQNNLQRTKEAAFACGGKLSPERLACAPTPLRKRRNEEAIRDVVNHTQPAGSVSSAGVIATRHGHASQDPAAKAPKRTESVPQAEVCAGSSAPVSMSPGRAMGDGDTEKLPSPGVNELSSSSDDPDCVLSFPQSCVCMFNIATPREELPQTPTGNRAFAVSCQENQVGSPEGDAEMRTDRTPASSSQCRKTRWSRGMRIACDPCQTLHCATALSLAEVSDCRHNRHNHASLPSKGARWRSHGSSAFTANVRWTAIAEECSSTLPMLTTHLQPAVAARGRGIEALEEDLAHRAKRFTERLRSCGKVSAARDGRCTPNVDTEFMEETKRLEHAITSLLMAASAREGRSSQVGQQPCRTRALSAPQLAWQDAYTFNDQFDTLVAGSPLPFCAPSNGIAFPVSNEEAKTCASGFVETVQRAARMESPGAWAAITSLAHMSPRTPRQLPACERASSTHLSPMFGTNLISRSMSPTCSGPRSRVEAPLPEQQRSEDLVVALRHESRIRRWGNKSNRPT